MGRPVLLLAAALACLACTPTADTVASATRCNVATLGYPGTWGSTSALTTFLEGQSSLPVASLGDATLTEAALAPYQILLIQDVRSGVGLVGPGNGIGRAYSGDEVEALRQWLVRGNAVMTLGGFAGTSDSLPLANLSALLAPHGLSYGSPMLFGGGGVTVPVTGWANHPIAAGVTRVGVDDADAIQAGGTPLAWDPGNPGGPVGRAVESGRGRVFAWGDGWIAYDSQWTGEPTYQVARLWANAFSWLGEPAGCALGAASR